MASRRWYQFCSFRFDGSLLYLGERLVPLGERETKVLATLLENATSLVDKELLRKSCGARSTFGAVDTAIMQLRQALKHGTALDGRGRSAANDPCNNPIHTIPGRGYVWLHPLTIEHELCEGAVRACDEGIAFWNDREPGSLHGAKACFDAALRLDRTAARGYAGLGDTYAILGAYGWLSASRAAERAKAAAERALVFDKALSQPHATRGFIHGLFERKWCEAEAELRQALEVEPHNAVAHHWYALHLATHSRFEEALRAIATARDNDALSRSIEVHSATVLYWARDYRGAVARCEELLELEPTFWYAFHQLGLAHEGLGQHEQALEAHRRAERCFPGESAMVSAALARACALADLPEEAEQRLAQLDHAACAAPFQLATALAAVGDLERAFACLSAACANNDVWVSFAAVDPRLDALRADTRFGSLLERLRLPR